MFRTKNYAYQNERLDLVRLFLIVTGNIKRYKVWVLAGTGLLMAAVVILLLHNRPASEPWKLVAAAPVGTIASSNTEVTKLEEQAAEKSVFDEMVIDDQNKEAPQPTIQPGMQNYYNKNSDMVGWIKIPNSVIDYPVVQAADNEIYMETDFSGKSSSHGSIFLDNRCNINDIGSGTNLVVYGHHMRDGSMFANLEKYKDENFFRQNTVIEFNTLYKNYTWEIFSVYVAPTTFNYIDTTFATRQSWGKFLKTCKEKSLYKNDVVPQEDDTILTLSTCSYEFDNARFVVQARLMS